MLSNIDHIVVLMLENRSFDCMLGKLYPKSANFEGLDGSEFNLDTNGAQVKVWNKPDTDELNMTIPNPDPGELWADINMQLFGISTIPTSQDIPNMSGFVKNYLSQPASGQKAESIMHYFTPDQVPVISTLARQFAVCDHWHASAPCQTWPNRFFVHTGTANGYENNAPAHFPYEMPTIYNRFEDAKIDNGWKIYFHDVPQSLTLAKLLPHAGCFRFFEEFKHDAKNGTLPCYSFIEPRYFSDAALPNDQHPPHVVTLGEQLIAQIYNCLRGGPAWTKTLFIITYDEHGGCYDHVPPPEAVPPSKTPSSPFNFDRYGVRVPAVIVSPYIKAGTVLRSSGQTPFDHTSIPATVRKRFNLGDPLSDREAVAPDLSSVLSLSAPENLGPETIEALPFVASPSDVAEAQSAPLNNMQQRLVTLAQHLPDTPATHDFTTFIQTHLNDLRNKKPPVPIDAATNIPDAVAFIKKRLSNLFGSL